MRQIGAIGRKMMIVDKYFRMFMRDGLRAYELNTAEGMVLLTLYGEDDQTQESMIETLQYDKGVMARTVRSLEDRRYIVRRPNSDDGRSSRFTLTETGRMFEPVLIDILRDWSARVLDGVNAAEVAAIERALETMIGNAVRGMR